MGARCRVVGTGAGPGAAGHAKTGRPVAQDVGRGNFGRRTGENSRGRPGTCRQTAWSGEFGAPRSANPHCSLLQAILRLGIPESRRTLLASCLAGLFASKPLQDLWEHSQAVAQKARDLAPLAGIDPDTAFIAGLLHDIGRLAFARLPAQLRIIEQNWLAAGFPVVYAECLAYGIDHAALGAECLRAWGLPDNIVEAVEFHHRPECSRSRLSALVTLADDFSEDLWPDMRRAAASLQLGFDPGTIAAGSMCG